MAKIEMCAVVYTDGSARPNHPVDGFMGCGVHGYYYDMNAVVKNNSNAAQGNIATDMGYFPAATNTAIPVNPLLYIDIAHTPAARGTNNQAEILAFLVAIDQIFNQKFDGEAVVKKIVHKTDSEYVRTGLMSYLPKWAKNGYVDIESKSIANKELWVRCQDALHRMKEAEIAYSVHWVRGNDTIVGNMQADYLSVIAMNLGRTNYYRGVKFIADHSSAITSSFKGYWNTDIERHPFINFRRLYYNTQDRFARRGRYFLSDPGSGDTYIGNRDPETGFAVVNLRKSDEIIDMIRDKHTQIANESNLICMMNLDRVYSKGIYSYLTQYGEYALLKDPKTRNLNFVDDLYLSQELNPSRLAPRALDCFSELESILECADGETPIEDTRHLMFTDITDVLYEVVNGKMALKKQYVVGFTKFTVPLTRASTDKTMVMDFDVPLIMSLDMPTRNHMKRLETSSPVVRLVTWAVSQYCFRYCVHISCDEGSGVWSNYFSDRIFFIDKSGLKQKK